MEKQVTSIEQSNRLLELGVPAEYASVWWERYAGVPKLEERFRGSWHLVLDKDEYNADHYDYVPAFTVADLIDIIGEPEGYTFYITRWGADYAVEFAGRNPVFFRNERLIDSAFQMVEHMKIHGIELMTEPEADKYPQTYNYTEDEAEIVSKVVYDHAQKCRDNYLGNCIAYGGTCLTDCDHFDNIKDIIERELNRS